MDFKCAGVQNLAPFKAAAFCQFCNAGEFDYGAISYLRFTDSLGRVPVSFITKKFRVMPQSLGWNLLQQFAVKVDRMLKRELQVDLKDFILWKVNKSILG